MKDVIGWFVRLWIIAVLVPFLESSASCESPPELVRSFQLQEISGFAKGFSHTCRCLAQPLPEAMYLPRSTPPIVYPEFISDTPLYGFIRVDMNLVESQSGTLHCFALDETGGTGTGYDRLHIDLNGDGAFADDEAMPAMADPPEAILWHADAIVQQVCFGPIAFSSGAKAEANDFTQTIARFTATKNGGVMLRFHPINARRGRIEIAGHHFSVEMTNSHPIGTTMDRPETRVQLRALDEATSTPGWLYSDRLMTLHKIGRMYWRLSTTPTGDRLFVTPYAGDFGTLEVKTGWGLRGKHGMAGTLLSRDMAVLVADEGRTQPVRSCRIPVGDYTPARLDIHDGSLYAAISNNQYAGSGSGANAKPFVYGLTVRKDKPYVLDLSDHLEFRFFLPTGDERIHLGSEMRIAAGLVDPDRDIMIRDLRCKPGVQVTPYMTLSALFLLAIPVAVWLIWRKVRRRLRWLALVPAAVLLILAVAMGVLHSMSLKINPRPAGVRGYAGLKSTDVAISRDDGQVVVEGLMPFG